MALPPSVLLLGAGELGLSILGSLANHPSRDSTPITILLRPHQNPPSPERQALLDTIKTLHASVLDGDVVKDSITELATLFRPFHTIIGCAGMVYPSGTQTKIAQAVLQAGVPVYYPWQFGVDYDAMAGRSAQDLFTEQLAVRRLFRSQAVEAGSTGTGTRTKMVIVSVGMFMSFLFEPAFGVVDLGAPSVRCLGSWDNEVTVTAVEDIGVVVADCVFAAREEEVAEIVWVAGDTVTYGRISEVVQEVLGRDVRRIDGSMEALGRELEEKPGDGIRKYRVAFGEGVGVAWKKERTWGERRMLQLQDLETWARQNLEH